MSSETKQLYEFENFRLDVDEKVLLKNGAPVSITPKALELLHVLIANHGRVVTKDFLLSSVWANSFVEESNLTFNIRQLRKILNDDFKNPLFIETVPRRGYRFIAPVTEPIKIEEHPTQRRIITEPPVFVSPSVEPSRSRARFGKLLSLIALPCLLLLGMVVTVFLAVRDQTFAGKATAPILAASFSAEKVSNSGKLQHALISPDGKFFVYTDVSGGKQSVWLKQLESGDNVQILPPSDNLYFGFAFSNDGQMIYFVRRSNADQSAASIYRMPTFGGLPEKLVERAEGKISLSTDGEQLSFVRCEKREEDFCALFTADANGRNERKLFSQKRPFQITDNQFSPDGRSIAFAAGQSFDGSSDYRLKLVDLVSGEQREISAKSFFIIKSLRWLPDGANIMLTAKENLNEKYHIWQISLRTGEAKKLSKDAVEYTTVSLNKTGDKLLATQTAEDFQLYFSSNGKTDALTDAWDATFAPDGKIYYMADNDIWSINPDGTGQRQLTNNTASDFSPIVSPDSRTIYFASNRTGANQIWRMSSDGTNQTQVTREAGGYPRFVSPDGKWVFYESGFHQTIWKVHTDSGEEVEVSKNKMTEAAFSPDGLFVAYLVRDKTQKIGIMQIADQQVMKIIDGDDAARFVKLAWSPDSRRLNFVIERGSTNSLWRQSLNEVEARFVCDLVDKQIQSIALSFDNNAIAYTSGEWLSDAVLVKGFKY